MQPESIHRSIKLFLRYIAICHQKPYEDNRRFYNIHYVATTCLSLVYRLHRGCYNIPEEIARKHDDVIKEHIFPSQMLQFDAVLSISYPSILLIEEFLLQYVWQWRINDISPYQYLEMLRLCEPCHRTFYKEVYQEACSVLEKTIIKSTIYIYMPTLSLQ